MYRECLRSIADNEKDVRTDELQQLHTLFNLQEILTLHKDSAKIPPTLRDSEIPREVRVWVFCFFFFAFFYSFKKFH